MPPLPPGSVAAAGSHPAWAPLPVSPVDAERGAAPAEAERRVGLCLSGGGYRAMLFHLGALWRLVETGFLDTGPTARMAATHGSLARVSSVSGGSITAGLLALRWHELALHEREAAIPRFRKLLVEPIRSMARVTIAGTSALGALRVIWSVLRPGSTSDAVARAYRKHLFGDATLQDLPDAPRFVLNASNLQSGALWRFSKPYARDWKVGEIASPSFALSRAVAASSAFPPVLSPATFELAASDFVPGSGAAPPDGLQRPPYTTKVQLGDGGIYDNLGLETVFKSHATVLVSDGGAPFDPRPHVPIDWVRQSVRVLEVIDSQVRANRVRQLMAAYEGKLRTGAYWGIGSDIRSYPCAPALDCPVQRTRELAAVPTDLARKDDRTQERLVNWGYAACDAALRGWVDETIPPPVGFPYPESGT